MNVLLGAGTTTGFMSVFGTLTYMFRPMAVMGGTS
jgi:hypothetical protein